MKNSHSPPAQPEPTAARPSSAAHVPVMQATVEMLDSAFVDDSRTVDVSLHLADQTGLAAVSNRPARALLLRMDGVQAGSVFALEQLPCTIGRHATNTLRVDEDNISRFHARISHDSDGFLIEDLESRNGTFVGGKRVNQHRLKDGDGISFGVQVAFRFNITDTMQERLLRRLYESSTRDALTGAYNRSHFDERLRAELAFATRHSTEVSLVMIDIDHFKHVNDSYGHQAGDAVLKELAVRAHRTLRAEDVFARFGGEEFAIILRGTNLDGARRLGERLRVAIEQTPVDYEGRHIAVTLSAGCASTACCTAPVKPEDLIRTADRRLYAAKTGGRNRVVAAG